jgi:hypothetical protein
MAASGATLELLRISDCDISTEHANDLQMLVQNFHWDKNEGSIAGFVNFDHYQQYLFDDLGEDDLVGHGTALRDSDSDGWDDYTDRWDDYSDGY